MKWPFVSRRAYEQEREARFAALYLIDKLRQTIEDYRARYWDLEDQAAEQKSEIEHYKELITGQLGDGPK